MERAKPRPLGSDETQTVLRRAAELDRQRVAKEPLPLRTEGEPRLEAADLERVAADSGLSRESVRRALAELHGGALEEGPRAPPLHKFVAGDAVVAEQTFDAPAAVIEARLAATLRSNGLSVAQKAPHATRWEPAPGLTNTLGRAVNWGGTAVWTGASVESGVHAVAGERTSAELRGDAKELISPIATLTGLLLAFPAGLALLVVLGFGVRWGFSAQHALALALILAAWMGLTALISRGVARRRVKKLRRALQRMLAQVATGTQELRGGA